MEVVRMGSPSGVRGDVPRDGTLPSREVVADQLRTLADWLDAHPGARVSTVSFIDRAFGGDVAVVDFAASTLLDARARAREIGGEWKREDGEIMTSLSQPIMPGFTFAITTTRFGDVAA